jgi:small subunit ribosomal protein S16
MKMMGRKHRPFFRICAIDGRNPRDGRVLEELGTYDPLVKEVDARALLKSERSDYRLGDGAQPSVNVKVLIKKYGSKGTHVNEQQAARERLAMPKIVPDAGEPAFVPKSPEEKAAEAAAPASEVAEAAVEAPAEEAASEATEE